MKPDLLDRMARAFYPAGTSVAWDNLPETVRAQLRPHLAAAARALIDELIASSEGDTHLIAFLTTFAADAGLMGRVPLLGDGEAGA